MSSFIRGIGHLLGGRSGSEAADTTSQSPLCVDEILWFEVLKRCDGPSLLRAMQTCRLFHKIVESPRFWLEKCEYDGISVPPLSWRKYLRQKELESSSAPDSAGVWRSFDYKKIYFRQPYGRDLAIALRTSSTLKNLEEQGMLFEHGGDGIIIENPPIYCESSEVRICFATSYDWCYRYCEIDLEKSGVEAWVMDEIRPKITVRERCSCREDCGATYELRVQLLRRGERFNANVNLPRFRTVVRSWDQWEGGKLWETVEEVFTNYPTGMRKLAIMSRGKDNQFWAGHYGSKFGATEVFLSFPENPQLLSPDDFPDGEMTFTNMTQFFDITERRPVHALRVPVGLRGRFRCRRHL